MSASRAVRAAALAAWLVMPALCQSVSVGVKAGVPFTASVVSFELPNGETTHWTAGPTIEFKLPARFSFGVDGLYRGVDASWSSNVGSANFFNERHVAIWEVPLYLKYRLLDGPVRPFVSGGAAFNHAKTTGRSGCTGDPMLCGTTAPTAEVRNSEWGAGFLFGGGVEFKAGRLTIVPEVRYTRWQRGYFSGAGPNQAALLVGFWF